MTQQHSHRLGIDQLTAACRQDGLNPGEVFEYLFEPVSDASVNCIAAELPRA